MDAVIKALKKKRKRKDMCLYKIYILMASLPHLVHAILALPEKVGGHDPRPVPTWRSRAPTEDSLTGVSVADVGLVCGGGQGSSAQSYAVQGSISYSHV